MKCNPRTFGAVILAAMLGAAPATAEKQGGILKSYSIDSPASVSIHEEATVFAMRPVMAVFNNLVLYDQHIKQNSMQSIVPELAKSWAWDEDGTRLTLKLHEGVKWHDGKPFTAKDVKCTWDLLQGKTAEKLRINPRRAWYRSNPDYWKPSRPYLDGIEYTIIRNMSTAILTFVSGKLDITFGGLTVPLTRDMTNQSPQAICELDPTNVSRNLIINPDAAPFDKPDLRRAMALSLDRNAFLDIVTEGKGNLGGVMLPPPEGVWGMPAEVLHGLPGYAPDVAQNRKEAQEIMQRLGYGPNKRLAVKVSTRDIPPFRVPAVILLDQLKEIYIDAELEAIDTTQWFPKLNRKDYTVALNLTGNGIDDPDQNFYENYVCGAEGNYNKYCNPELDKMVDRQSMEANQEKRKALVWEIERKLAEDGARPIIFYAPAGNCRQPYVKGLTIMSNSIYNGWRMEDVWIDK